MARVPIKATDDNHSHLKLKELEKPEAVQK